MRSEKRYFGMGLVIGVGVAAPVIIAMLFLGTHKDGSPPASDPSPGLPASPTNTSDVPSYTPSVVPTFTSIPTLTSNVNIAPGLDLAASPTPDPVSSTIHSGGLIFRGPLSNAAQVALYRASLAYVQTNTKDSIRESKEINGVGYGDPTNICGPLAIAILRDAGLISPEVVPHDFWLLNPLNTLDQRVLTHAFPPDRFTHTKVTTPLNKVDWLASPLEPGDFLFIWHGSWGNFDHMLVVNRVDAQLRTYAVTNYGTPAGFIIAETLLYDPHDPGAGIFHTWTKEKDAILGSTGFGGYEVWRSAAP